MKIKRGLAIILFFIFLLIFAFRLTSATEKSYPSYEISAEMENEFKQKILGNSELNSGVTLYLVSLNKKSTDTEIGEYVDIAILNHTDEHIIFPNGAYGLRTFSPRESFKSWAEINSTTNFGDVQIAIAPHTETKGTHPGNTISLLYSDYEDNLPQEIRFCVFGIGKNTQKEYVACLDTLREE